MSELPRGPGWYALRVPAFRTLFAAQSISVVGDAAYAAVLAFFVYEFTGSSAMVSVVLATLAVATLVSLAAGGVIADRWDRRRLMMVSDGARCVLIGGLAVAVLTGTLSVPLLVVLAGLAGFADGFFGPAMYGSLPSLVSADRLTSANGLIGFVVATGSIFGAALGGTLYAVVGAGPVLAVNALSFGISALLISRLPKEKPRDCTAQGDAERLWRGLRSGLVYVWRVPVLLSIPVAALALMVADAPTSVLVPAIIDERLGGGAATIGWMNAMLAGGTALGALITGHFGGGRRPAVVIFGAWGLAHAVACIMFLQDAAMAAIVLSFVRGLLSGMGSTLWNDLLMRNVDRSMLSRVFSLDAFGATALMPVGVTAAGVLASSTPVFLIVVVGQGIATMLMLSLLLRRRIRDA